MNEKFLETDWIPYFEMTSPAAFRFFLIRFLKELHMISKNETYAHIIRKWQSELPWLKAEILRIHAPFANGSLQKTMMVFVPETDLHSNHIPPSIFVNMGTSLLWEKAEFTV